MGGRAFLFFVVQHLRQSQWQCYFWREAFAYKELPSSKILPSFVNMKVNISFFFPKTEHFFLVIRFNPEVSFGW